MTIKQLRKAMHGLDENMEVFLADHDHSEYETNSGLGSVAVRNQEDYRDELKDEELRHGRKVQPVIDGDYLVLHATW